MQTLTTDDLFLNGEIGKAYQDAQSVGDDETMARIVRGLDDEARAILARWHERGGFEPVPAGLTLQ
jgi:hypothetical protein